MENSTKISRTISVLIHIRQLLITTLFDDLQGFASLLSGHAQLNGCHARTPAPIYTCTRVKRSHPCHTSMRITIHGVSARAVPPVTFSCSAVASDLQDTDATRTVTLCVNFTASYCKKVFVSTLAWNLIIYVAKPRQLNVTDGIRKFPSQCKGK
jgi:hypothetical protein